MTQPTKKLEETYRFSRDYSLLYRPLHEGHRIVGFVDYDGFGPDNIARDVIAMRYFSDSDHFQMGSRGMGYEPYEKKIPVETFTSYCQKYNIEFIAPTANIVRIEGGRTVNIDTERYEMDKRNIEVDGGTTLTTARLLLELTELDSVLAADGYKKWSYSRLALDNAMEFIRDNCKKTIFNDEFPVLPPTCWIEPTPENLAKHGDQAIISFDLANGPDVSAEVTYFTSPQTDKLHFHPSDEDQNEQEDSNLRRFRSIENPPLKEVIHQVAQAHQQKIVGPCTNVAMVQVIEEAIREVLTAINYIEGNAFDKGQ